MNKNYIIVFFLVFTSCSLSDFDRRLRAPAASPELDTRATKRSCRFYIQSVDNLSRKPHVVTSNGYAYSFDAPLGPIVRETLSTRLRNDGCQIARDSNVVKVTLRKWSGKISEGISTSVSSKSILSIDIFGNELGNNNQIVKKYSGSFKGVASRSSVHLSQDLVTESFSASLNQALNAALEERRLRKALLSNN